MGDPPSTLSQPHRRRLLFRDGPADETVLVIHGTFANAGGPAGDLATLPWWRGDFCRRLDALLASQGSGARCWAHRMIEKPSSSRFGGGFYEPFAWTGDNSEFARRTAAVALANELQTLEQDSEIRRYHIVAHSHGGNVLRQAVWLMPERPKKIAAVAYLGTPFLHFSEGGRIRYVVRRVHWLSVLVLIGFVWTLGLLPQSAQSTAHVWGGLVAAGIVSSIAFYFRKTREGHARAPGTLFCFEHDEAVALLTHCAQFARAPERLLFQLFRPGPGDSVRSESIWNDTVRQVVERSIVRLERVPLLGGLLHAVGVLLLVMGFAPYRPRLIPFLNSRMPRLRGSFMFFYDRVATDPTLGDDGQARLAVPTSDVNTSNRGSFLDPLHQVGVAVATIASVAAYVLLYPVDWLLGIGPWLGQVGSRLALWIGVRATARTAFGMDVIGAGFRVDEVATLPPEVTRIPIDPSLENSLLKQMSGTAAAQSEHLRRVFGTRGPAFLVESIREVFADTALLHSQYYQDERIIAQVATAIASASSGEQSPVSRNPAGVSHQPPAIN
jgi:hypothetical protein